MCGSLWLVQNGWHFDLQSVLFYEPNLSNKEGLPALSFRPDQWQYLRALADCHMQLSRFYWAEQKAAAEKSLAAASGLFKKLARSSEDKRSVIAQVDAEMRRAVFAGFDGAGPQLTEAARLSEAIEQNWPTNPTDFYKLVSILTQRDAVLATDVEATDDP